MKTNKSSQRFAALWCIASLFLCVSLPLSARHLTLSLAEHGIGEGPGNKHFCSQLQHLLDSVRAQQRSGDKITLLLAPQATYHLYAPDARQEELYISNHDQNQPKKVGILLQDWENLTLEGQGSRLICHGRMLPIALLNSRKCRIQHLSVDFADPQIAQVEVVKNDTTEGITFRVADETRHRINEKGYLEVFGDDWAYVPFSGIAFEKGSRHIVYRTSDLVFDLKEVRAVDKNTYLAPHWKDNRLPATTIVAMRSYFRPAPGLFMTDAVDTRLQDVTIHYAEGMGLIAQRCTNINLQRFNVCLRGDNDSRYFTTQADATHFSQCKGRISSTGGLYEGMMDDAINVHGIYLKVMERVDDHRLRLTYGHDQAWGFAWGDKGDVVRFIQARCMQDAGVSCTIRDIQPAGQATVKGCKEFIVTFTEALPQEIVGGGLYGAENMTWTPEVYFADNVIRNNRARGALFSSPLRTVCERNFFDHTSGSAIVLCGDCNGWYESGAVRNLVIRNNRFLNALTNLFQFTSAIISIYPEIPEIDKQTACFHGGDKQRIVISDNTFETFDIPLLYAKSIKGLRFENNRVIKNQDYPAFHPNNQTVKLEHTADCVVK